MLFSSVLSYRIPSGLFFNDWLQSVLYCGDVFSVQVICTIIYKVWLSRNLKLYQSKEHSPVEVAADAVRVVADFNKWNHFPDKHDSMPRLTETNREDVHSIHMDASISNEGNVALGCLIKDQHQNISLAACKKEDLRVDISIVEPMAVKWGLSLSKELSLNRIVMITDAKTVVDSVNFFHNWPMMEPILIDIRSLLSSFSVSSLLFQSRNCNVQAHNLARLG